MSPYSAMQNITITENGVYKLLRNIKPHKATEPDNIQARDI
jgi:sulfur relay (sulfurtransferase) DsrF/TusC family protein